MNKYIDAEKLIAELNKIMGEYDMQQVSSENPNYEQGAMDALYNFKLRLSSLQQEQREVNLEKEISCFIRKYFILPGYEYNFIAEVDWEKSMEECARHFYELGLNARK